MSPVTLAALVVAAELGWTAEVPAWLLGVLTLSGQLLSNLGYLLWRAHPSRVRMHARVAGQMAAVTAVIYATGWGPNLAIGYAFVGQDVLTTAGATAAPAASVWSLFFLAAAQVAIALGIAPSLMAEPQVHGLAALMALGLVFVFRTLALGITEKEQATAELAEKERWFRSLVQNSFDLLFVVDASGAVTYASPSVRDVLGFEPSEVLGYEAWALVPPADVDDMRTRVASLRARPGATIRFAHNARARDGRWHWLEGSITNLLDDPAIHGFIVNVRDATERRRAEEHLRIREQQQAMVAELGRTAVSDRPITALYQHAVDQMAQALPIVTALVLQHTDDGAVVTLAASTESREALPDPSPDSCDRRDLFVDDDGARTELVAVGVDALSDDDAHFIDAIAHLLATAAQRDCTQREIRRQALHDPLTRLPNRTLLTARIDQVLADSKRNRSGACLLVLDLDGFKEINDTLGHSIGDQLLTRIGQRIAAVVRDTDTVARLGGDEFAVLVGGLTTPDAIDTVVAKITSAFEDPVVLGDMRLALGASIGVAMYPEAGTDSETLLRHADVAMYQAKASGDTYRIYRGNDDKNTIGRLRMLSELQAAIGTPQLVVFYQPKVDLASRRPLGIEALVRWRHPTRGLLPAEQFIGLLEGAGQNRELTRAMLRLALDDITRWVRPDYELDLAVNLSPHVMHDVDLVAYIGDCLHEAGVPAEHMILEVTETALVRNPRQVRRFIDELRSIGVRFSLDDFGTGYSSLAHLKELPIDEIKIDKSFVRHVSADERDLALVRSVNELGISLGLDVVAEGIEDDPTRRALLDVGVRRGQGYLFARPMPVRQLVEWLDQMRPEAQPETGRTPTGAAAT